MSYSETGVPVYVEVNPADMLEGVFAIEGDLRYSEGTLTFDYRTRNVRSKPSAPKTFQLTLDDLQDAILKDRLVKAKLILQPRRLSVMDQVPWSSRERIVFHVKRAHRGRAAALAAALRHALAQHLLPATNSIPFELPSIDMGFTEVKGLLYLDDEFLVFEVGTGLAGGSHSDNQTIKVEPGALAEVRHEQGLLHDHLIVRPKKDDLLTAMPGTFEGELKLKIKKPHRREVEYLVHEISRRNAARRTA